MGDYYSGSAGMRRIDKNAGPKLLVGYLAIIALVLIAYGLITLCSKYPPLFPILLIGFGTIPVAGIIGHIVLGE